MSEPENPAGQQEHRLVPKRAPWLPAEQIAKLEARLDNLKVLRGTGALTLKLASILRYRLVELCGDESDPDGPMYPPTVEELATLLDEELRLADLLAFLQSEAYRQGPAEWNRDPFNVSLENWRCSLIDPRPEGED